MIKLSFFEGSHQILELISTNTILFEFLSSKDLSPFYLVCSETDHLPLKKHQHHWNGAALTNLNDEFLEIEQWASIFMLPHCKYLLARLTNEIKNIQLGSLIHLKKSIPKYHLKVGTHGTIIDIHHDDDGISYEVEFMEDGKVLAQLALTADYLSKIED
jgi:hypothetical protein